MRYANGTLISSATTAATSDWRTSDAFMTSTRPSGSATRNTASGPPAGAGMAA
jgi:hypothetical protein